MFIPIIFVFENNNAAEYIKRFEANGYKPFYNSKNAKDYQWFKNNVKTEHRLYVTGNNRYLYDFKIDDMNEEMNFSPDFMIAFQENVEMNDLDWDAIYLYIRFIIYDASGDQLLFRRAKELLPVPVSEKIVAEEFDGEQVCVYGMSGVMKSLKPEYPAVDGHYHFRTHHIEERDTMLYEITRPGTILPFTVVIEKYSVHGNTRLFSDIYGSDDWDMNRRECRFDYLFLQNLWKWMQLSGEFTMNVVKERVDSCYPDRLKEGVVPESEPIVYRRSIENVIDSIKKKDQGYIYTDIPEHIQKKRKYDL